MIPIAKPSIGAEELEAAKKALESGQLTGGPLVKEFEEGLAKYCDYRHAIAVSSGTAALDVAMHAFGVKEGEEAIVPDFTFIATANAPRFVKAVPRFADVDARTFNINVSSAKKLANKKTRVIIPVSLYGQCYDVDAVQELAEEYSLRVLSDNAQAIGTKWKGKKNLGDDCAILSFYPTKNMTTTEGGAILTDDGAFAEECRLWRNIGQRAPYDYAHVGYNYRLNAVSAAIGTVQLRKLDGFAEARRKNAGILNELLEGVVETPFQDENAFHVFNQYTIKTSRRDELKAFLASKGVGANVYYPSPLHSLPTFSSSDSCPATEKLCKQVLSLPVHPAVTEEDLQKIADAIKNFH